jgi:hypothetical protein
VVRVGVPRAGIAYRVDDSWRERVALRLVELAWTHLKLAENSGCPRSLVSELLSGKRHQTTYLPEMHAALGWEPPLPPLPPEDAAELLAIWSGLGEAARGRALKSMRAIFESEKRKK